MYFSFSFLGSVGCSICLSCGSGISTKSASPVGQVFVYQASAWIIPANISLSKAKDMTKLRIKGQEIYLLTGGIAKSHGRGHE